MRTALIIISVCFLVAVALVMLPGLLRAGEPKETGAGSASTPPTGTGTVKPPTATGKTPTATGRSSAPATGTGKVKPPEEPRPIMVYIKGADEIEKLDNTANTTVDYSSRYVLQFFELTQNSKTVLKKYDNNFVTFGGWSGLRRKLKIDVIYDNLKILRPGLYKWSKDDKGKWKRGDKYTDKELTGFADYLVETSGSAKLTDIIFLKKVFSYRYDAAVKITVTNRKTGKVIFEESEKGDYTCGVERGKKKAAVSAVRIAAIALALEVIGLDEFKEKLALPDTSPPKKPEKKPEKPPKDE